MRTEGSEQLDLHNRSVGAYSRKHGTCFPSTITQYRFSNQEVININSHYGKTQRPFLLDIVRKFSERADISESFKNEAYSDYRPVPHSYFFDWLYGMFRQFVIGLIHRSCTVDQIKVFSSFQ